MKSESYFPTIKIIFDEFKRSNNLENNTVNIILGAIREHHNDREGFYLFSNLIQINPILFEKFSKLCKENNYDEFVIQQSFLNALRKYPQSIENKRIVHLIELFLKNPKYL